MTDASLNTHDHTHILRIQQWLEAPATSLHLVIKDRTGWCLSGRGKLKNQSVTTTTKTVLSLCFCSQSFRLTFFSNKSSPSSGRLSTHHFYCCFMYSFFSLHMSTTIRPSPPPLLPSNPPLCATTPYNYTNVLGHSPFPCPRE